MPRPAMRLPLRPTLLAALLSSAAVPATAQNTPSGPAWYASASAGASQMSDPDVRATLGAAAPAAGELRLGGGGMFGGSVGRSFGPGLRVEAEVNYRSDTIDAARAVGVDARQPDADLASVALMVNALKDFDGVRTGWAHFRPYVGAGIGVLQELDADVAVGGTVREFSARSASAWQLLAGVRWTYRSGWFADAGVRWLDAGRVRLDSQGRDDDRLTVDYKGLGLDLRVGYRF